MHICKTLTVSHVKLDFFTSRCELNRHLAMGNFAAVEVANLFAFESPDGLLLLTRRFNFFQLFVVPQANGYLKLKLSGELLRRGKGFFAFNICISLFLPEPREFFTRNVTY
jgi:hypothetical protein